METKPRTAMVLDEDDEIYSGFNDVAPALDTRSLKEDQAFQETLRTAGIGRKPPSRLGTSVSDDSIKCIPYTFLYMTDFHLH